MNMEEIIHSADYLSQKSDRWLFLGALIVGVVAVTWLVRYLIIQITKMSESEMSVRVEFTEYLKTTASHQTEVISENNRLSQRHLSILERVERKL